VQVPGKLGLNFLGRNDMFTTFFTSQRRLSAHVLTLLLSSVCLCTDVAAQTPSVISSSAAALPHPSGWGQIWNSAIDSEGDFVVLDWVNYGIYEFPANGGPATTVAAPGQLISGSTGNFWDLGIGIDKNDRIFTGANFLGQEGLFSAPYDPATGTWDISTYTETAEDAVNQSYFQSAAITAFPNATTLVIGDEDGTTGIFTVTYDPVTLKFATPQYVITGMQKRARSIAVDAAGNIYFYEDGGAQGVLRIPAGTTGLTSESALIRVDPNLNNIQGVTVDATGNVYVADQSAGVFLVPNESGTPNPAHAVLLTPAQAQGTPSLDQARGILYVPTAGWNGFMDVVKIYLNRVELGAAAVGATSATAGTVYYSFSATTTPHSFVIEEAGSTGDFTVTTGGTCVADTAYVASNSCTLNVNLTPHTAGDVSATLAMLDANGNVLATTILHGVGQGSSIVIAPGTESAIGSGLQTPSQVATDASGNIYVADSGLGKVLVYAKGSGSTTSPVSIGTGLTAPTGVATDGTGDVFIADSGKVVEVPYGQGGLNAAGQVLLKSGLGTNLKLSVDGTGDVFVADPDNQRVVKLSNIASFGIIGVKETDIAGFNQLSAIAADGSGDLFVANGQNLIETSPFGVQTTVLNTLAAANGLAVDASGAVYITSSNETVRIPNQGGTLNAANQTTLAMSAAQPTSVAVDSMGNVYVTDAKTEDVDYINANGFLNLGTLASGTVTSTGSFTIFNDGNASLNIAGFSSTADFSAASSTCVGTPVAVGAECSAIVTFSPGPGDQGNLSGQLLVQSDTSNAPIGINVVGTGATLAASTSTITLTAPTVTNAPVVVKVVSTSGTGPVPTGNATVTVTGNGLNPVTLTQPLVNGTVTFNETTISAGSYTFTVSYGGDRVYGTSTASTNATLGAGAVMLIQPPASSVPTYVLSSGTGSQPPFDGSQQAYYYNYPAVVKTANGAPLLGVPIFNGKVQTGTDYGNVTYQISGGGAACTGSSSVISVNADGTAPFPTNCLNINTSNNQIPNVTTSYTITPMYTGNTDSNYGAVMGTPFTVIAIRNPSVMISSNPGSLIVAAGSATTATLTLTSLLGYGVTGVSGTLNNYSLPVELGCDALPAHATCSFSYPNPDPSDANSVDVTPTAPGQVVMTINTNVPVGTTTAALRRSPTAFAAIFGLSCLGLAFGRKKTLRASLSRVICLPLFCGTVVCLSSCSTANITPNPVLTTPKGTYTITVTAKQTGSITVPNPTTGGAPLPVYGNGNQMSIPFTMMVTVQ
jgi:hypothetical protein